MTSRDRLTELADMLADARRQGRQLDGLASELVPPDADTAYRVNAMVAERLGWEPLGWKIAGTTQDVRTRLGIDTPIYGRTFRRFAVDSPAVLQVADLLSPLIECEFFVTLAQDLPHRDREWTMPEVVAAIGQVNAGIEVAECRFPNRALPPLPGILADGSASGRYVFGDVIPDWQSGLADMAVTLETDGTTHCEGKGSDVMGDPLRPLLWLAEERRRHGDGLRAGETISTGSTTGMLPVRSIRDVRVRFGEHAEVRISFAH